MDQQLLADVKQWVGFQTIPEVIQHRRTPDRIMKLLHIASDWQSTLEIIPKTHRRNEQSIENCRRFLKIFAVGLAYAHYSTDGFSAEIDFPEDLILYGKKTRIAAMYNHKHNKIIITPWFMFNSYRQFGREHGYARTINEAILGLPYGTEERFCLMGGVEEGIHAALAPSGGMGKESPSIDYQHHRFGETNSTGTSRRAYEKSYAEQQIQERLPKIWQDFGLDKQHRVHFATNSLGKLARQVLGRS